jgi:hypothetical protein
LPVEVASSIRLPYEVEVVRRREKGRHDVKVVEVRREVRKSRQESDRA